MKKYVYIEINYIGVEYKNKEIYNIKENGDHSLEYLYQYNKKNWKKIQSIYFPYSFKIYIDEMIKRAENVIKEYDTMEEVLIDFPELMII